jgi:tetratricopeptide (TPR) repeat protein
LDIRKKVKYPSREHERAVKLYPHEAQRWLGLGQALLDEGEFGKAAEAFREAVNLDRGAETLDRLGQAYLLGGDLDAARECLEEATSKHGSAHAWYGLGRLHAQTGDHDKARESFGRFVDRTGQRLGIAELDRDYQDAQARLANLHERA